MDRVIESGVEMLNAVGQTFCFYAWRIFIQVSVLIAVLLVVDLLLRRHVRAVVRYAMWMLVFVKLLLPPTLSLPTGIGYYRPEHKTVSQKPIEPVAEQPAPIALVRPVRQEPVVVSPPAVDVPHADVVPAPAAPAAVRPAIAWQGLAFLGWFAGVLILSVYLLRRVQYVRKLIRRSTPASETLADVLTQCAAVLRLRSCPALRLSDDAPGPAVCGLFRPVVLMPTSLAENLGGERLRTVLVHELAHVRRADLWVNFAQTLLLVVYFYHPLLWLANAIVRRLREQAVDETVLVALDAEAESYGTTLIDLAEMTFHRPALGLRLIGIAESRKALEGRIRHMITQPKPRTAKLGLCGLLAVAIAAAVLLPMARAKDSSEQRLKLATPNGRYKILLLEDRDDQDADKDQYDDRLYLIDSDGYTEGAITGFHIGGSVGGSHVLALDEQRRTLWVVENAGDRLCHFDLASGKLLRRVSMPGVTAAAIDPATGNVWCTISGGRIGEGCLQVISPSAEPVATHPIAGFDITHSVHDNSFWVVGKSVYRIGTNGKVLGEVTDQIPWTAVSASVDQKTGNAWVVVRDHPNIAGSRPELWAVDENVRIQQRIDLGELMPFCVAVDSDNEIVWVGCLGTTLRYTTRGEKLTSARYASGFSVVPGRTPNEVFAAHEHGVYTAAVEASGAVLLGDFPKLRDHLSSGRKWLARVPFADAKLQSTPELADLTRQPPTPEEFAPVSAQKLAALGKALLIYANDYEDRFPEALQGVRTFLSSEDFAWLMQSVVYLGKGKTISVRPDTILAYDRTLLEKGEGTLVLFADSHVAFKSLRELETLGIDLGGEPSAAARHESATQLSNLGRALLIYTYEHDDKLPETLADVQDEIDQAGDLSLSWVRENAVYLGRGMTASNEPDDPVAYDKTLYERGGGTNVLHLDTSVAFESPERLEELGIAPDKPSPAALRDSTRRLRNLGRSLVIYAHNHDDTFPDTLEELPSNRASDPAQRSMEKELAQIYGPRYAEQMGSRESRLDASQLAWYREHVQYLGKGVKANDNPAGVLAYDKTLLAEGKGTNVLYVDARVEFVTPERFKELMPAKAAESLPDIFILSPSRVGFNVFDAVLSQTQDWTWNKTGRYHDKEAYAKVFYETDHRTSHDILVLVFTLDSEDRIPAGYEDLLPVPWDQIEQTLRQGKAVEVAKEARGLHVILLAAPDSDQLKRLIAGSKLLADSKEVARSAVTGCDIAIEDFKVRADPDLGTFAAIVSIRNRGVAACPKIAVYFYRGDPETATPMMHGAGPLEPGQTWNEVSSQFALREGANEVHVVLDPGNLVAEPDEANNRATLRIVIRDGQITEQSIVASATPNVSAEARVKSATRLSDLGKTLLIYANDHDDKLPDELTDVRRQYGVGFSWLYDNVAYLGKGMTVRRDNPKRPTAYDKTLIRRGAGTNVLYLDTQVAFESPARLEELGIRYEPKPKSAEELRQEGEIQARVTVLNHLRQVALAAHLYASDNDGVFPDTLEMLEPYLSREEGLWVWVRENVEYTGKGLNPANLPELGKPIAYSRLASDQAVIAFVDGHVEYVIGPRLKELGIEIKR